MFEQLNEGSETRGAFSENPEIAAIQKLLREHPELPDAAEGYALRMSALYPKQVEREIPNRLEPLFLLHHFNDFIESSVEKGEPAPVEPDARHWKKLSDIAREEELAEGNRYLPTIGTEIEIPETLSIFDEEMFYKTRDLGIPRQDHEPWEFRIPYTYSAHAQSEYIHELIGGHFIETEGDEKNTKIKGSGNVSLHLNFGIPKGLGERAQEIILPYYASREQFVGELQRSFDVFTNAITYAFTSPERIVGRKNLLRFGVKSDADVSIRHEVEIEKYGEGSRKGKGLQRLEVKSLECRDKTLYRMLEEAQFLVAALFEKYSAPERIYHEELGMIWEDFEERALAIQEKHKVPLDALDEAPEASRRTLEETAIQKDMRTLITKTVLAIKRILDQPLT